MLKWTSLYFQVFKCLHLHNDQRWKTQFGSHIAGLTKCHRTPSSNMVIRGLLAFGCNLLLTLNKMSKLQVKHTRLRSLHNIQRVLLQRRILFYFQMWAYNVQILWFFPQTNKNGWIKGVVSSASWINSNSTWVFCEDIVHIKKMWFCLNFFPRWKIRRTISGNYHLGFSEQDEWPY